MPEKTRGKGLIAGSVALQLVNLFVGGLTALQPRRILGRRHQQELGLGLRSFVRSRIVLSHTQHAAKTIHAPVNPTNSI